ncbi:MAG: outer membrane protein assembly factor BamA [Spirochaetes bacterium GWD1_61_31]|nr:MAG: outer membrane protein assembly factor BamA [Spirochaetes bacterium GWB1_60_80]OHD35094.1 MAG: outer membrane protein assembly factor BamA [Spirochaetes bacterium GWC1_61_12]OHD43611.1 MAG: outer membrane protein assembly factor BamA [Spirochaetes bacterium GWD1_61_31]OHD44103.1 MAG: outer membrane protein assembly factor BamA [Spirochaetes bacterium GWE1_60_18]OHD61856.1 MAG: outer membrane protein assembly factor BamA [Spirochaetes bacterium GWF1_60_12]
MKRWFLVGLLAVVVLMSVQAQADTEWYIGKPIRNIRFEGLQVVTNSDLDAIIREYRDQAFSAELWMQLLTAVYQLDYFTEIAPEAVPGDSQSQSVVILFRVVERPALRAILFDGNRGIRTAELQEVLSIKLDSIFNQGDLRLDEIAIRRLYLEKGYAEVAISSRFEVEDNRVTVFFDIVEGTKVTLDSIIFEGASAISAQALKGEMVLKERGLFQSGAFNESLLLEDRKRIEFYYKTRGYLDITIVNIRRETVLDERAGAQRLTLYIELSEGQRYLYDGVSFAGNVIFDTPTLEAFFRFRSGSIFNYARFLEADGQLRDLYYQNGYIFNEISMEERRDAERGLIAYQYTIQERERAHIENITIRGNDRTMDEVILREIPLEAGDIFSNARIRDGMRNLYNLQYFSSIEPELLPGSQDLLMELVFNVVEQSTAEIQFGVSLSGVGSDSAFPISGLLKWNEKNFLGRGQSLDIDLNVASNSQNLSFGFTEPWLFNQRWSTRVELAFQHTSNLALQDSMGPVFSYTDPGRVPDPYSSWAEYQAAGNVVPSAYYMNYDTWSLSLGLSTGYIFKTLLGDLGLGGGYNIALNNKTYDDDLFRPYDAGLRTNLNTWLPSNRLFARAYLNQLDMWFDPTLGYYASQRFTLTGFFPGELERYTRSDTRLEGYLTLFNLPLSFIPILEDQSFKMVLGLHSSVAVLMPWFDGATTVSGGNRLGIDGTFIGRGWGTDTNIALRAGSETTGGTALWSNWLELRIPIIPGIISLDSFLDAAVLASSATQLYNIDGVQGSGATALSDGSLLLPALNNIAFSFGFGLRFTLQQLPLRLYLAKPFYYNSQSAQLQFVDPDNWEFVLSFSQPLN